MSQNPRKRKHATEHATGPIRRLACGNIAPLQQQQEDCWLASLVNAFEYSGVKEQLHVFAKNYIETLAKKYREKVCITRKALLRDAMFMRIMGRENVHMGMEDLEEGMSDSDKFALVRALLTTSTKDEPGGDARAARRRRSLPRARSGYVMGPAPKVPTDTAYVVYNYLTSQEVAQWLLGVDDLIVKTFQSRSPPSRPVAFELQVDPRVARTNPLVYRMLMQRCCAYDPARPEHVRVLFGFLGQYGLLSTHELHAIAVLPCDDKDGAADLVLCDSNKEKCAPYEQSVEKMHNEGYGFDTLTLYLAAAMERPVDNYTASGESVEQWHRAFLVRSIKEKLDLQPYMELTGEEEETKFIERIQDIRASLDTMELAALSTIRADINRVLLKRVEEVNAAAAKRLWAEAVEYPSSQRIVIEADGTPVIDDRVLGVYNLTMRNDEPVYKREGKNRNIQIRYINGAWGVYEWREEPPHITLMRTVVNATVGRLPHEVVPDNWFGLPEWKQLDEENPSIIVRAAEMRGESMSAWDAAADRAVPVVVFYKRGGSYAKIVDGTYDLVPTQRELHGAPVYRRRASDHETPWHMRWLFFAPAVQRWYVGSTTAMERRQPVGMAQTTITRVEAGTLPHEVHTDPEYSLNNLVIRAEKVVPAAVVISGATEITTEYFINRRFDLVPSERGPRGAPVYRASHGDVDGFASWLYLADDNKWYVGVDTEKDARMHGSFAGTEDPVADGTLPHEVPAGTWYVSDSDGYCDPDPSLTVRALPVKDADDEQYIWGVVAHDVERLVISGATARINGAYDPVMPVPPGEPPEYRRREGDDTLWLYFSTEDYTWNVNGIKGKTPVMARSAGPVEAGTLPTRVQSWELSEGGDRVVFTLRPSMTARPP